MMKISKITAGIVISVAIIASAIMMTATGENLDRLLRGDSLKELTALVFVMILAVPGLAIAMRRAIDKE